LEEGVVDKYSEDKGFGFIIQNGGEKLLFKRFSLNMSGYKTLTVGDRVAFEVEKSIRGPEAVNVTKL